LKVSIVITTKNRINDLKKCIDSILASTYKDFELIIVDDCSNDGTEKLAEKDIDFEQVKILHMTSPLMMAEARNTGARKSSGEYVLFIDDDNIIAENMFEELVECADKHAEYGIVGPRMFYLKERKEYMSFQKINLFTGKTAGVVSVGGAEIKDSDGIPNVFLVKKEVFSKSGYFDGELMQSYTEPDFSFRARKFGFKTGICKSAVTYHNVSMSDNVTPRGLGGNFPLKAYCLIRNRFVLLNRYANIFQKIIFLLFFSWIYPLIYSFFALWHRRFDLIKLYWFGFRDGLMYFITDKLNNAFQIQMETK